MGKTLTDKEELFCELYVNGSAPYTGNATKCYMDVFKEERTKAGHLAKQLIREEHIKAYIDDLEEKSQEEAKMMKRFLTANLMHIIEETSAAEYKDRRGNALSPAALRSVAVNASKALMDLYPVKEAQVNKLNIEGADGGGITFNVIVPEKPTNTLNNTPPANQEQLNEQP